MASFYAFFPPLDVLNEIWDAIESVSEGFLTYLWFFSDFRCGVCYLSLFLLYLNIEIGKNRC